jgi:hypothetical protein
MTQFNWIPLVITIIGAVVCIIIAYYLAKRDEEKHNCEDCKNPKGCFRKYILATIPAEAYYLYENKERQLKIGHKLIPYICEPYYNQLMEETEAKGV